MQGCFCGNLCKVCLVHKNLCRRKIVEAEGVGVDQVPVCEGMSIELLAHGGAIIQEIWVISRKRGVGAATVSRKLWFVVV